MLHREPLVSPSLPSFPFLSPILSSLRVASGLEALPGQAVLSELRLGDLQVTSVLWTGLPISRAEPELGSYSRGGSCHLGQVSWPPTSLSAPEPALLLLLFQLTGVSFSANTPTNPTPTISENSRYPGPSSPIKGPGVLVVPWFPPGCCSRPLPSRPKYHKLDRPTKLHPAVTP